MAAFILNVLIAASLLTIVLSQNNPLNINRVINGTQDYYRIVQAELLFKVKLAETENDAVNSRLLDRLAVIDLQQQQVLNATKNFNETIIPLQALNLVRKYCIQTYESEFVTYKSVNDKFKDCIYNAQRKVGSLASSNAKTFTGYAREHATYTLPRRLQSCQSSNNNQTQIEQCYIDIVQNSAAIVENYLTRAQYYRDQNIFELNDLSLEAVRCSFDIGKGVLETIARTSKKINDCVDSWKIKNNGSAFPVLQNPVSLA